MAIRATIRAHDTGAARAVFGPVERAVVDHKIVRAGVLFHLVQGGRLANLLEGYADVRKSTPQHGRDIGRGAE